MSYNNNKQIKGGSMKRLVLLVILGIALTMLFAQEEANVADTNTAEKEDKVESVQLAVGVSSYSKIFWGVVNSSLSETEVDGTKLKPANGFQIGISGNQSFLQIKGETVIDSEHGFKYTQRNYKTNSDEVSRSYLDFFFNLSYDVLGKGYVYPYVGFGVNWLLSGPHQSEKWVNDVPLNIGIELLGFRYEYSHGTYTQTILDGHKAKTNTHSFSWGLRF